MFFLYNHNFILEEFHSGANKFVEQIVDILDKRIIICLHVFDIFAPKWERKLQNNHGYFFNEWILPVKTLRVPSATLLAGTISVTCW